MTMQKRSIFYGLDSPGTALLCGFDDGDDKKPVCGEPAKWHGWPGRLPDSREDFQVYACDEHFHVLHGELWDYHPIGGACGIPGSEWVNGPTQGKGMCRHELDETTIASAELERERERSS